MAAPVHMIGDMPIRLKLGRQVSTRCGIVCVPVERHETTYEMLGELGGNFRATTRGDLTTCRKCRNLIDIGMIHRRT